MRYGISVGINIQNKEYGSIKEAIKAGCTFKTANNRVTILQYTKKGWNSIGIVEKDGSDFSYRTVKGYNYGPSILINPQTGENMKITKYLITLESTHKGGFSVERAIEKKSNSISAIRKEGYALLKPYMKDKSYFVMVRKAPYKDRFVGSISTKNGKVTWMGSKGDTIFESVLNPDGTLGKSIRRGKIELI